MTQKQVEAHITKDAIEDLELYGHTKSRLKHGFSGDPRNINIIITVVCKEDDPERMRMTTRKILSS